MFSYVQKDDIITSIRTFTEICIARIICNLHFDAVNLHINTRAILCYADAVYSTAFNVCKDILNRCSICAGATNYSR